MFKQQEFDSNLNPEKIYIRQGGLYFSIFKMGVFLGLILLIVLMLNTKLFAIFASNKLLNTFILSVFIFGVVLNFKNTFILISDSAWINDFFAGNENGKAPRVI